MTLRPVASDQLNATDVAGSLLRLDWTAAQAESGVAPLFVDDLSELDERLEVPPIVAIRVSRPDVAAPAPWPYGRSQPPCSPRCKPGSPTSGGPPPPWPS
ncbi:hypothetical protein ACFQ1L_36755 [Phytohabitans flavus]|uniref:hypothetical protein n=1 Tax=Phytohabitans flavus TaxID=1076124 RepID=UPI003625EE18